MGCVSNLNLIAYFVSPEPVPATVEPSSPAALVNVCANLAPPCPPAAVLLAIVFSEPSPQSTSKVFVFAVFVVLFCRYTVAPVLAVVIGEPPDDAAYMANCTTGAGVAMAM